MSSRHKFACSFLILALLCDKEVKSEYNSDDVDSYCANVDTLCDGTGGKIKVYDGYSACQSFATNYFIGENVTSTRDTLFCRQEIYGNNTYTNHTVKCTDIRDKCVDSPNLDDFCVDQDYACGVYWGNARQWDSVEDCKIDMANIKLGNYRNDTTDDTLACRLHYLRLAHASTEDAEENCPKINKTSTACNQKAPAPPPESPHPPSDKEEDDNTLIYIIVGSVGGGLLFFTVFYYFCRSSSKSISRESRVGELVF